MLQEKRLTIQDRFAQVKFTFDIREKAGQEEKPQFVSFPHFRHVRSLFWQLEGAMRGLESFFDTIAINPMACLKTRHMDYMILVNELLSYFESWADGETSSEVLVNSRLLYCKREVLRGSLANHNSTSPMDNMFSVMRYKAYCEIVRTIEHSMEYEANREREQLLKEAAKANKKKVKA